MLDLLKLKSERVRFRRLDMVGFGLVVGWKYEMLLWLSFVPLWRKQ